MIVRCRLREIRGDRTLAAVAAAIPEDERIGKGQLSLIEQGRLLPRDRWLPALEVAYGAPRASWYAPEELLVFQADPPERTVVTRSNA